MAHATRTFVYSALGRMMEVFALSRATGALTRVQSTEFPAVIQYGWFNRGRTRLYVASSDAGPMMREKLPNHFVQGFGVGANGTLTAIGDAVALGNRPLHVTLDAEETHLLLAYNHPSDVTVHRLAPDGSVGEQVPQAALGLGPTTHQVRITPDGRFAVVPCCAHDPEGGPAGSVALFSYAEGRLTPSGSLVADPDRAAEWRGIRNGAAGFAARHVDFHPRRPWMYLLLERQSELQLYDLDENGIAPKPRFMKSTLEGAATGTSPQLGSAVHVHPNGRFVYTCNRAWEKEPGREAYADGANGIAVFRIDQSTGEATLIQQVDSMGIFPRTFGIDATGEILVVGNQDPGTVRAGEGTRRVLPGLAVYAIAEDGTLRFLNKSDHPDNGDVCFWVGVASQG